MGMKSQSLFDALSEKGFYESSYYKTSDGYSYCSFLSDGSDLYCGLQSADGARIVRSITWEQIFKPHQRIKLSDDFLRIKPLKSRGAASVAKRVAGGIFNVLKRSSPQHSHSNVLEFQNILASFENGVQRETRHGDVLSFDFDEIYIILHIERRSGYVALCRIDDFTYLASKRFQLDCEKCFYCTRLYSPSQIRCS